jgi:hypothetical protein
MSTLQRIHRGFSRFGNNIPFNWAHYHGTCVYPADEWDECDLGPRQINGMQMCLFQEMP